MSRTSLCQHNYPQIIKSNYSNVSQQRDTNNTVSCTDVSDNEDTIYIGIHMYVAMVYV